MAVVWPVHGLGDHGAPKDLEPHIVVQLKPGWKYDSRRRRFVSDAGGEVAPRRELPKGTRIVYMVPALAKEAAARALSEDEENLARFLHVRLPAGTDAAEILLAVKAWPCVEKAHLPPEVSLPDGGPL